MVISFRIYMITELGHELLHSFATFFVLIIGTEELLLIAYCPTSNFRIEAEVSPLRCPYTSEVLEYTDLPEFDPDAIDPSRPGHWRYAAMLPVIGREQQPITLGEGWTSLIQDQWAGLSVYWKMDALLPSGSYKDRGISVMVNWLANLGIKSVVNDSSGNAGASLACYAARAGMHSCIFVPSSAPEPKRAQIAIYGSELVEVPGPREAAHDVAEAATLHDDKSAYASHAWHPAFLLGQMTLAWELWEQLGGRVPDWLIAPTGQGGLLLGAWRGFQHLYRSGVTNRLPRLISVQVDPYTPIYEAMQNGWSTIRPRIQMERICADGVAIANPVRGTSLLAALHCSQGAAVTVTEEELLEARTKLAERGLFVEPTSATIAAALEKISASIEPDACVVGVLSGHGLKNLLAT